MLSILFISAALATEPLPTLGSFGLTEDHALRGGNTLVAAAARPGVPWSGRFAAQRTLREDGFFPGLDDRGVACVLDPGMAALSPSLTMHTYGSADLELGTRVLSSALVSWALDVVELPVPPALGNLRAAWGRAIHRDLRGESRRPVRDAVGGCEGRRRVARGSCGNPDGEARVGS